MATQSIHVKPLCREEKSHKRHCEGFKEKHKQYFSIFFLFWQTRLCFSMSLACPHPAEPLLWSAEEIPRAITMNSYTQCPWLGHFNPWLVILTLGPRACSTLTRACSQVDTAAQCVASSLHPAPTAGCPLCWAHRDMHFAAKWTGLDIGVRLLCHPERAKKVCLEDRPSRIWIATVYHLPN